MLMTNYKEKFKRLAIRLESLKNQKENTFNLKTKDFLNKHMIDIKDEINEILDEYNRGQL